jgi:hypothetical protein
MERRAVVLLSAVLFFAAAMTARAQANPPAQPPTPAPAQASGQESPSPAKAPPPSKKVWTNEDLEALHDHSVVSTFQSANQTPASPGAASKGKDARWYHDQIAKLEAQIPPLDEKIARLRAALAGDTVNETRHYGGVRPDDWRVQLAQLEKKRDDIEAKISALEDQARHEGVSPNALP